MTILRPRCRSATSVFAEGNAGTTAFVFSVTLSAPSGLTVTVNYATANGLATAPGDYASGGGTLTFVPGDVSEDVVVNVVGDADPESNETFLVNLSSPVNATLADGQATGTIVDDDTVAVFSVDDVTAVEPTPAPRPSPSP